MSRYEENCIVCNGHDEGSCEVCKWEADHQKTALEPLGLADEFPYGCDTIAFVGEALLAARKLLVVEGNLLIAERDKTQKLIDALQDIAVFAEEAKYMRKTAREVLGSIGVELEKDED